LLHSFVWGKREVGNTNQKIRGSYYLPVAEPIQTIGGEHRGLLVTDVPEFMEGAMRQADIVILNR
jgi:hypothetical protein